MTLVVQTAYQVLARGGRPRLVMLSARDGELIEAYCLHQRRKGLAASTISQRLMALKAFAAWHTHGFDTATRDDVEQFLDGRPQGSRTRAWWISTLHCFYDFGVKEGHLETDPTAGVVRPRLRRLVPRPAAEEDIAAGIASAGPRMRALLLLPSLAGLRCVEIARLRREDVFDGREPPVLLVHGKGDKDRVVPLHPELRAALYRLPLPSQGFVFHKGNGRPLLPREVSRQIAVYFDDMGLDVTAHRLRHFFATRLYQASSDLRLVQEVLGHSSPMTTAIYTQFSDANAVRAVSALPLPRP